MQNINDKELRDILKSKNIAVVGLSSKKYRASYGVSEFLISKGYNVFPVNPYESEIFGIKVSKNIEDINEKIDIVDIFRRSSETMPIVKQCLLIKPALIWFQEGVINQEAYNIADSSGLKIIMDKCILKEHIRLI